MDTQTIITNIIENGFTAASDALIESAGLTTADYDRANATCVRVALDAMKKLSKKSDTYKALSQELYSWKGGCYQLTGQTTAHVEQYIAKFELVEVGQ